MFKLFTYNSQYLWRTSAFPCHWAVEHGVGQRGTRALALAAGVQVLNRSS